MLTKERKLPQADIASRFSTMQPGRSPEVESLQTLLGHDYLSESMYVSEEDCHDPCAHLSMPGANRIRAILGLRKGASLPNVNAESMLAYYRYLLSRMTLPCEATYSSDAAGAVFPVMVAGLIYPETIPFNDQVGLCCIAYYEDDLDLLPLVDIEVDDDSPNFQLLEDYWFWLWNWRESRSYRSSNPR